MDETSIKLKHEMGFEEAFMNSVKIEDDDINMVLPLKIQEEEKTEEELFAEGVSFVISKWTLLQESGALSAGMDYGYVMKYVRTHLWRVESEKMNNYYTDVFYWFIDSKDISVAKLSTYLQDRNRHIFKGRTPGGIQIAKQLMSLYEVFLEGKRESNIEKLRESVKKLRESAYHGARLVPPSVWMSDLMRKRREMIKKKNSNKEGSLHGITKPKSMKVRKGKKRRTGSKQASKREENTKQPSKWSLVSTLKKKV